MAHSDVYAVDGRYPITPPLSDIADFRVLASSISPRVPAPSKGSKRKTSCDSTSASTTSRHLSKRSKPVRSSSQPALRERMARSRDGTTPDFDDEGIPIRYTPTTGRRSRAKKGLPVHHCQYGCGKIYTRAEHRKRHEQNHLKDAPFKCTVPDCQNEFQRLDLLQRHLKKHHGQILALNEFTRASSVESSNPTTSMADVTEQLSMHGINAPINLELTNPSFATSFPAYAMSQARNQVNWQDSQQMPSAMSGSSAGAYANAYANPQMALLQSVRGRHVSAPPAGMQEQTGTSTSPQSATLAPASASASGTWQQAQYWPQQSSNTPGAGFPGPFGAVDNSRGRQFSSWLEHVPEWTDHADSNLSTVFTGADRPELVAGDAEHLQHYHSCYWELFDPLFPIVHRPSYSPSSAESTLLGSMIIAIGAQFSQRPHSKEHSLEYYEIACSVIHHTNFDPSAPNLHFACQGIFLWEYFSLFKRRTAGVHTSEYFAALCARSASLRSQSDSVIERVLGSQADGEAEYSQWLHAESERRLLIACFILDIYRTRLFFLPSTMVFLPAFSPGNPGPSALWTAPTSLAWAAFLSGGEATPSITPFKTALDHALGVHLQGGIFFRQSTAIPAVGWALQLASRAPLRELLMFANHQASLFFRSVSQEEWRMARSRTNAWLLSPQACTDVWYAINLLSSYFLGHTEFSSISSSSPAIGLETKWCLYLAVITIWTFMMHDGAEIRGVQPEVAQMASPVVSSPISMVGSPQSISSTISTGQQAFATGQVMSPSTPLVSSQAIFAAQDSATPASSVNSSELAIGQLLQMLDTSDPTTLVQFKGQTGAELLLIAVRDEIIQQLRYEGMPIEEAVDVLNNIILSEEFEDD